MHTGSALRSVRKTSFPRDLWRLLQTLGEAPQRGEAVAALFNAILEPALLPTVSGFQFYAGRANLQLTSSEERLVSEIAFTMEEEIGLTFEELTSISTNWTTTSISHFSTVSSYHFSPATGRRLSLDATLLLPPSNKSGPVTRLVIRTPEFSSTPPVGGSGIRPSADMHQLGDVSKH